MVLGFHSRKITKNTGRRNNKLIKENFSSSIESLPNELLTEIVARVASASFKNYINVKLRECGNTEALYRKGVMDFFKNDGPEVAVKFLKRAAKGGHIGAFYVMGIIMVFIGGDFKRKGVTLIGSMKETKPLRKITKECRQKLVEILAHIWVRNPLVLEQRPTRCTIQHQRIRRNGWPLDSDDEDEDMDVHCDACSCDEEIAYIVNVLPRL
ncbi:hypothetical protein HAX54_043787 [Datura stramonium]|uniref:At2g35280-like TPR domain-containing protein n=1 Tax=Datura stramonium TaxID=4076 RepID=A0ABS8W3K3_DATST|nr:hypothetical protein [Datura stramonium]